MDLNPAGICEILRACREVGVAELKFGRLQVTFGTPSKTDAPPSPPTSPDTEISESQARQIEHESLESASLSVKEDQLEQMLLEDPYGYEQLLASGDLEDEKALD